jgi:CubicO group peptidase (beta-lactamase class C family)
MRRWGLFVALLVGLSALGPGCDGDSMDADAGVVDRFTPLRTKVKEQLVEHGINGAAVAVIEAGELTFAEGFGQKLSGGYAPVLPTTYFRIGSVTKIFTAIALLQLVDAGLVDLEAPLLQYVPEFHLAQHAEWVPEIRVKHLLTHSSGIQYAGIEFEDWPDQSDGALDSYLTHNAFATRFTMLAPPGRMFIYSNLNFDLAGLIVERVSGRSYREYMRDRVFAPLGLERTTFDTAVVLADGDYWYGWDGADFGPGNAEIPWMRPAGLAYSTIIDLAKLARFLMRGDPAVLSPASLKAMRTPQVDLETYGSRDQWGCGLRVSDGLPVEGGFIEHDFTSAGHPGVLMGVSTSLVTIPEHDFAVVYSVNKGGAFPDDITTVALTTLGGFPDLPPGDLHEDPANFPGYVGTYESETAGTVEVALAGTGLRITVSHTNCIAEPVAPKNFACKAGDDFTFLSDVTGNVEYLRFIPIGNEWVARRTQ